MTLTARDKKLLIGLGIFIFIVLFVKFLLFPKFDKISVLNTEIATLNNTYATNLAYKTKTESIDSNIKILSEKLKNLRAIYPPRIGGSELLIIMRDLIKESKLKITLMKFDEIKPTSFQEKNATGATTTDTPDATDKPNASGETQTVAPSTADVGNQQPAANTVTNSKILNYFYLWGLKSVQADSDTTTVVIPDGKAYSVSVKIEAEGTNEQIKAFFTSLMKLGTKAYCKNSSIAGVSNVISEAGGQKLKFTAEVVFYGIMDKAAGGYYILPDGKWMPISGDNKTNLFKEYSGFMLTELVNSSNYDFTGSDAANESDTQSESATDTSKQDKYDFSVVASAFGGGLAPSVSIACKNPKEEVIYSSPVVYGDSKDIENAEIFIEEKAGKYYCKFKTDHESYPNKQYNQTFEFVPEGKDLRLVILSSERSIVGDKAGVNISIINNTDKDLTYKIKFDDKESPRIKIGKTVGSVINEK
jgi:type IV pilus assembly protein PilO